MRSGETLVGIQFLNSEERFSRRVSVRSPELFWVERMEATTVHMEV